MHRMPNPSEIESFAMFMDVLEEEQAKGYELTDEDTDHLCDWILSIERDLFAEECQAFNYCMKLATRTSKALQTFINKVPKIAS